MPELAEVRFFASRWDQANGKRFSLSHVSATARCCRELNRELAARLLKNAPLLETHTHGKRMLFAFGKRAFLEVHLGMTGALAYYSVSRAPEPHEHFVLRGPAGDLVFRDPRQFGQVRLHCSDGLPEWWTALPPQPQEPSFTLARFESNRKRRARSPLKSFLLQQDCFPGIGNWMADEILWQAQLRPDRAVEALDDAQAKRLYQTCRRVSRAALRCIGIDYSDPPRNWLFHSRWRDGGSCPKTGQPLRRESIGGRTTCWSPAWQD